MSTRTAIASVAEEQQGFFSQKWLLRASEPHPVFSQVLDSIQKERKKSVRNLPEGNRREMNKLSPQGRHGDLIITLAWFTTVRRRTNSA
jgi:hypothetical protein